MRKVTGQQHQAGAGKPNFTPKGKKGKGLGNGNGNGHHNVNRYAKFSKAPTSPPATGGGCLDKCGKCSLCEGLRIARRLEEEGRKKADSLYQIGMGWRRY